MSRDPGPPDPPFLRRVPGGVALRVRLTPRADRDAVAGVVVSPPPEAPALALRLTARPVDNEANRALVAYLARALALPRSAISLEKGAGSRVKTLRLKGDPDALSEALSRLAGAGN